MEDFELGELDLTLEHHVPANIYRLAHHYHNLIYIMYFWEQMGQQKPPIFAEEVRRTHDELIEEIEREKSQGGLLRRKTEHEARPSKPNRHGRR